MSDERTCDEQGSLKDERTLREEVYCCAVSPGEVDYACTLPPGHAGDHIAESWPGNICAQWPSDAPPDVLALRNHYRAAQQKDARIPVDGALRALRGELHSSGRTRAPDVLAAFECLALAIEQAQAAERAAHPLAGLDAHIQREEAQRLADDEQRRTSAVTPDPSIEARAIAAAETYIAASRDILSADPGMGLEVGRLAWQAVVRSVDASRPLTGTIEPEASITLVPARMTTHDTLQAIAALVKSLNPAAYPSVCLGTQSSAGYDTLAPLDGVRLTSQPHADLGTLASANVEVGGVEFYACWKRGMTPDEVARWTAGSAS